MHGDNVSGLLCLRSSTPGMSRGVYGNFERHLDTYYRPYPGRAATKFFNLNNCIHKSTGFVLKLDYGSW